MPVLSVAPVGLDYVERGQLGTRKGEGGQGEGGLVPTSGGACMHAGMSEGATPWSAQGPACALQAAAALRAAPAPLTAYDAPVLPGTAAPAGSGTTYRLDPHPAGSLRVHAEPLGDPERAQELREWCGRRGGCTGAGWGRAAPALPWRQRQAAAAGKRCSCPALPFTCPHSPAIFYLTAWLQVWPRGRGRGGSGGYRRRQAPHPCAGALWWQGHQGQ